MIRATTPTLYFTFPETIDNYDKILIVFSQKNKVILEKTQDDLFLDTSNGEYGLTFTQEETNKFADGLYQMQVRYLVDGEAGASPIFAGRIFDVLNDTVLEVTNAEV